MDLAARRVLLTSVCILMVISGHNVYLREPLGEMAQSTVWLWRAAAAAGLCLFSLR